MPAAELDHWLGSSDYEPVTVQIVSDELESGRAKTPAS